MATSLFYPLLTMVAITAAVWVRLYIERIGEIRERRIPLTALANARDAAAALARVRASDHFKNLFEVPLLFHLLCLLTIVTRTQTPLLVGMAWAYVALRAAHALIHCTYNDVMHRFVVYASSTALLFAMWAGWAFFCLPAVGG